MKTFQLMHHVMYFNKTILPDRYYITASNNCYLLSLSFFNTRKLKLTCTLQHPKIQVPVDRTDTWKLAVGLKNEHKRDVRLTETCCL